MKKIISLLLLIFIVSFLVFPQYSFTQDFKVDLNVLLMENMALQVHQLLAAQLATGDNQQGPALLFSANLINNSGSTKKAVIKFSIRYNGSALANGDSNPFDLDPGITTVTNITILSKGNKFSLNSLDLTGEGEDLLSQAMYTGVMPPGNYEFELKLVNADDKNEELASGSDQKYFVKSGGNLVLMSPGQNATYPDIREVYTDQPTFQWQSNSSLFELFLFEEQADDGGDAQAVIDNEIYAEFRDDNPNINKVTLGETPAVYLFQLTYPPGARRLQTGLNYYWKVNALDGSGGTITESEIWRFKYVDPSQQDASKIENQQILSLLRVLLGDAKFEELFVDEGGEFVGYVFKGEMFNGDEVMDFNDLHEIYIKFLSGLITLVPPIVE
ncbi:hypothetical protein H8E88_12420 [candidate division KSB1 bacterium]|nr:hypothetical protein [candidate division KSB1 bacterium]